MDLQEELFSAILSLTDEEVLQIIALAGLRWEAAEAEGRENNLEDCRRELELETEGPGYGLLMVLCEQNKSDARFVSRMITRARVIADCLAEKGTRND